MERTDVYKLIDSERDYQDWRWNSANRQGIPDEQKHPADWLNYMEFCLNEAKKADYYLDGKLTMENIRKIAGLAVRAMELHETPVRVIPNNDGGSTN